MSKYLLRWLTILKIIYKMSDLGDTDTDNSSKSSE